MGNSASSSRNAHDETVDYGHLVPQGIYTGPRDWNEQIVAQAIVDRKLAPFYRPLEDYEEDWDDEKILANRKEPPPSPPAEDGHGGNGTPSRSDASSIASSRLTHHHKRSQTSNKEPPRNPEALIYRGATECPICFLYYPPNINRSRCCDQPVCTECFVQIKRSEPTTQHLQSDPACCPYCVQENFGVVYTPPPWRAGLGSEGSSLPPWPDPAKSSAIPTPTGPPGKQKRRKSFGANDAEVVTTDHIRPDWEAKLEAVKAQAARRANRRIIMRQVGDRLIPVGVTSGRVHALPAGLTGEGAEASGGGSGGGSTGRRSRRRQQNEIQNLLGGMAGQDLEELMVMEAMRLSLLEHEEQQRKEKEAKEKEEAAKKANGGEGSSADASAGAESSSTPAGSSAIPAALANIAASSPIPSPIPTASATPTGRASPREEAPVSAHSHSRPQSSSASPAPGTPTPAHPELPSTGTPTAAPTALPPTTSTATPALATSTLYPASADTDPRPIPARSDTMLSTMTDVSMDGGVSENAGYGYLAGGSEESVVAREPLLADDA
ncbi:hypothetical protein PENSPDRAFT_658503 [Peniophora sp. CONT]|nr:hypothetical protein PENSPDRAFT_658503 [Peniophora sp. CONT]